MKITADATIPVNLVYALECLFACSSKFMSQNKNRIRQSYRIVRCIDKYYYCTIIMAAEISTSVRKPLINQALNVKF